MPLALASAVRPPLPSCGGCYSRREPALPLLAAERFTTCSTSSCLLRGEPGPMKCHVCNGVMLSTACAHGLAQSSSGCAPAGTEPLQGVREGAETPEVERLPKIGKPVRAGGRWSFPFLCFSSKFYGPSSHHTLGTLGGSTCQKHTGYIGKISGCLQSLFH